MAINRGASDIPFASLPVPAENQGFAHQRVTVTVATSGQATFALGFTPNPAGILTAIVDRKTYFMPDVSVRGSTLSWHLPPLPPGKQVVVEVLGQSTAAGQLHAERHVVTATGQVDFRLDGIPVGDRAELYYEGSCYPQAAGFLRVAGNRLTFTHPSVRLRAGASIVAVYPRTRDSAGLCAQQSFALRPGRNRTFTLSVVPSRAGDVRVHVDGLRYFEGQGTDQWALGEFRLTVGSAVPFDHGSVLTISSLPARGYLDRTRDDLWVPQHFLTRLDVPVAEDDQVAFALGGDRPPYRHAAMVSLNGLGYAQGHGFEQTLGGLTWDDLALRAGETLELIGFLSERVGVGVKIKELSVSAGKPTWNLRERVPEIHKSLLFLSADGSFGGQWFAGERYLLFPDDSHITWNGAFDLKNTDKAVVLFWKDAFVAGALEYDYYVAGMDDVGTSLGYRLSRPPHDPGQALVLMNGLRLRPTAQFLILDDVFRYLDPRVPVKADDKFVFVYR